MTAAGERRGKGGGGEKELTNVKQKGKTFMQNSDNCFVKFAMGRNLVRGGVGWSGWSEAEGKGRKVQWDVGWVEVGEGKATWYDWRG